MARRYERFTFVCSKDERALIAMLAERLHRTRSDAVRFVVMEAVRAFALAEENHAPTDATRNAARDVSRGEVAGTVQNVLKDTPRSD